ncbi:hypothetical protein NQ318_009041 [Aromia moschata]|uniref:Cytochrome c oxidase assembly protein COX20, mitochondrial n=1 Tax=Aromia moschata TaxID=1265417 RepID=A0AAV8YVZ8_9CUCU|nr:hypothetical protein NQ318_009041 [Aromia moschata]
MSSLFALLLFCILPSRASRASLNSVKVARECLSLSRHRISSAPCSSNCNVWQSWVRPSRSRLPQLSPVVAVEHLQQLLLVGVQGELVHHPFSSLKYKTIVICYRISKHKLFVIIPVLISKKISVGLYLFGRDISKIPCFRNSLLYGIGGGLCFGLARFMITSQTLRSVNFAVYSFSFITMAYWIQCRFNYSKSKFEMLKMQEMLRQRALLEGTTEEQAIEAELGSKPVDV